MSRTLTIVLLIALVAVSAFVGGYIATIQSGSAVAVAPGSGQSGATAVPTQASTQAPASRVDLSTTEPVRPAQAEPAAAPAPSQFGQAPAANEPVPAAAPVIPGYGNRPQPSSSDRPGGSKTATSAARKPAATPPTHAAPAAAQAEQVTTGPPVPTPAAAQPVEPAAPAPQPKPQMKAFEEFIVPAESVLGLQLQTTVTTETSKVEDPVEAKVTRDVRVGGTVVIPAGTRALGSVTEIERGGKVKGKARIGVRFTMLVLADATATRVPVRTDTVFRESESQGEKSATKIGAAAVGGAILGAIIGGGKGAAIGSGVGAAGGTAAVMAGKEPTATLPAGAAISVRLQEPVTVVIER